MAYPMHDPTAAGVPASPDLPAVERRVLEHWAADKTFEARVEQRDRPATNGENEYVFYDGPPFANGLPHYGHLLTGYVKDVVPRYQTMRGRRVERRFGWDCHGLPAEVVAEKQLGITSKAEILDLGRGPVQRGLPHLGAGVHPGLGAVRHPAGPLGRLRQRLQDPRPGLHGKRHVGLQDPARQGSGLRGLPGAGVLLALRDAAVEHRDPDGRRLPRPARPGADRVVRADRRRPRRSCCASRSLASGPPRRGPCRRTWRSPSAPTSSTRCWRRDGEPATSSARPRLGAYAKELEGYEQVGTVHGARPGRAPLHAAVRLPRRAGRAERVPGARRGLRHHRGRHRDRPPGPGLRRGRPERLQRRRHPDRRHRGRPHPVHRAGPAVPGRAGLRRRTSR